MTEAIAPRIAPRIVGADLIREFGELTGDFSSIHFDAESGRAAGFKGTIAHGLLTASWAFAAVSQMRKLRFPELTEPAQNPVQMNFRLSHVVEAGETVRFEVPPSQVNSATSEEAEYSGTNAQGKQIIRGILVSRPKTSRAYLTAPAPFADFRGNEPQDSFETSPSPASGSVFYAEDLVSNGPRGQSTWAAIGVAKSVEFARSIGVSDADDALPMLNFCLGFSDFLSTFLKYPMPNTGSAGHVGDSWQLHRPLDPEEPLQTRFQPLSSRRSSSQPELSLVTFGIQRVAEDGAVVQSGETVMMIAGR